MREILLPPKAPHTRRQASVFPRALAANFIWVEEEKQGRGKQSRQFPVWVLGTVVVWWSVHPFMSLDLGFLTCKEKARTDDLQSHP